MPCGNVLLAHFHIAQDGSQVQQHRHKTHIGQFAVVLHQCAANGSHQVTAEKTELGISVLLFQRLHQVRGMKVATGFSGYQIVFQGEIEKLKSWKIKELCIKH